MSTTKRKREDDSEDHGSSKKLKLASGDTEFTVESLHRELWIQIFANINLKPKHIGKHGNLLKRD